MMNEKLQKKVKLLLLMLTSIVNERSGYKSESCIFIKNMIKITRRSRTSEIHFCKFYNPYCMSVICYSNISKHKCESKIISSCTSNLEINFQPSKNGKLLTELIILCLVLQTSNWCPSIGYVTEISKMSKILKIEIL